MIGLIAYIVVNPTNYHSITTAPWCCYSPLFNFLILVSHYSENVTETIHTAGVHVFQANSQNVQTCQVDVGFTPKPDEQGTSRMCFKAG